jgi:hypothetical protein
VSDKVREALAELVRCCPDPAFTRRAALDDDSDPACMIEEAARCYRQALNNARAALSSEEPAAPPGQPCPDCDGRGMWMPRGGLQPDAPCKRCGGTGRVTPPPSPEPAPPRPDLDVLEKAARIAETEPEPIGPMPPEIEEAGTKEQHARAAVRATRTSIAQRIRALRSDPAPCRGYSRALSEALWGPYPAPSPRPPLGEPEPSEVPEEVRKALDAAFVEWWPPTKPDGCCLACGMWTPARHPEAHDHEAWCPARMEVLRRSDPAAMRAALETAILAYGRREREGRGRP